MLKQPIKLMARLVFCLIAIQALWSVPSRVVGQAQDGIEQVRAEQVALAERYRQLEAKLFSLQQFEKKNNPARSKLLQQAFLQSQEKMTIARLQQVVELLADEDYKEAERLQAKTLVNLSEMLKLLQAEDRSQKIRDDLERYKAYVKEVDRILRIQKGIRGQAEGGVDAKRLAKAESKAGERASKLSRAIQSDNESADGGESSSADGNPSSESPEGSSGGDDGDAKILDGDEDSAAKDLEAGGAKPSDGQSKDAQPKNPKDGEAESDSDSKSDSDSESGGSSAGQDSNGQQPSGSPASNPPAGDDQQAPSQSQSQDPVQQKIDAAQKRMQQAQQDLKNAKRENAIESMRKAEKELEAAKKELEEILRQLREEEVESKLKLLEERFRGMLEQQVRINEATDKLIEVPGQARGTEFEISANRMSGDENQIAAAAGRALVLLKEDGSSIAFPVTVEELQQDMLVVAKRLSNAKVNEATVAIQADIVETLNELIAALVKIQEDMEQQQQQQQSQPPQSQGGKPGEEPLVNQIAELKMLKSLQLRIHRRHERYSKFLDDPKDLTGVNQDPDVAAALQRLADRQAQLTTITRQLVNEENK